MVDREKIIKGLECCSQMAGKACNECPYVNECNEGLMAGVAHLADNALSLIKGQESLKQKMWNAFYAEEDKLENHYIDTGEIGKWIVDYRPFLQRGFEIAIEVIAAYEEGR